MSGILQALLAGGKKLGGTAVATGGAGSEENTEVSSFTLPSVPNDCLVVLCYVNVTNSNVDLSVTSGGWTEVADLYANDVRDTNFGVSYQYYETGGDKSITLSHSCKWAAVYIEGAVPSNPLVASSVTATGTNTPRPTPPTITVPEDSLILALAGSNNGGGSMSALGASDGPDLVIGEERAELVGACTIAAYSSDMSGAAFSQWFRSAEIPTDCSWAAVTMGIR